jgi:predicted HAD superfamily Cof-like phosphohydrolase
MSEYQYMVSLFNKGIGQERNDSGTPKVVAKELRISLIAEEAKETADAILKKDTAGFVDGLCDLLYVVYGAADVFGVQLKESEVRIDMAIASDAPAGWDIIQDNLDGLQINVDYVTTAIAQGDVELFVRWANDLVQGCWMAAADGLGIDLRPFFREVHRANMQKLTGPKRADGKQLKPEGWQPPRIQEMLNDLEQRNLGFGRNEKTDNLGRKL